MLYELLIRFYKKLYLRLHENLITKSDQSNKSNKNQSTYAGMHHGSVG